MKKHPYWAHGHRLLHLVDQKIFDYFIGNADRTQNPHFALFEHLEYDIFYINWDQGRAFGRPMQDPPDQLSALRQCCVIRPSTLRRLVDLYAGEPMTLTRAMRR